MFIRPAIRRKLAVCGLVLVSACKAEAEAEAVAEAAHVATAAQPPAAAESALSTPADAPSPPDGNMQLAGDLRPESAADLAFKIAGQLLTVKVQRGQSVKKGQLLAALADSEAHAQLAQSEAAVQQARSQLALARDNEARSAMLVAANAAPGSQATAVRLQAETAQAALQQAMSAQDLASVALSNHQLKAPFDGEIVRVPDGVGQIVAPGTVLFRLEALDRLLLRATVSENEIDRIHVGDAVIIDTNSGGKVTGKVRLVLRSLEAASRRAPVEVTIPNRDRSLVAGSYVRATLQPAETKLKPR